MSRNNRGGDGQSGGGQGNGAGKKPRRQKNQRKQQKITARTYWGGHTGEIAEPPKIRPSTEPAAVVRSLGIPPLTGQAHAATEYFDAVYGRAVNLAVALATAGDLLATDDEG